MQHELIFCFYSFLAGILLTVGYDILRIFRNLVVHNSFFIGVEDIIYGCIAGLFLFSVIYGENDGIIRLYALFFAGVGSRLYSLVVSKWIVKKLTAVFTGIFKKILKFQWDRVIVILTGKKSTRTIGKQVYEKSRKRNWKKCETKENKKNKSAK